MSDLLEPGTYRLTRDLPALEPDKRKTRDWRAQPMKAGTLFYVARTEKPSDDVPDWARDIWDARSYAFKCVRQRNGQTSAISALVSALERVYEWPSTWLDREHRCSPNLASHVLDILVRQRFVSMQMVKEATEICLNADPDTKEKGTDT